MTSQPRHVPVLLDEALAYLDIREGGTYIDCTTGLGGHSEAIAERIGDGGRLLCIDQDSEALEFARARLAPFGRRAKFVRGNFRDLADIAEEHGFTDVDGVLLDLGVSSLQLEAAARGFAFGLEGPLDMRMAPEDGGETAADIVNTWGEAELADMLRQYGEVRGARRIARSITRARPIGTTWELARAVEQAVGGQGRHTQIHPATLVFLALRVRVNGELDSLDAVLPQAHGLLGFGTAGRPHGGRLVLLSFHSLEDRMVKQYFRREARECVCPPALPVCRCDHRATLRELTRRPIPARRRRGCPQPTRAKRRAPRRRTDRVAMATINHPLGGRRGIPRTRTPHQRRRLDSRFGAGGGAGGDAPGAAEQHRDEPGFR
ncbi:MAG: 16S rRNA (cytosine(1402)-N(4))-methyltransferase RsmH [Dehalococcoidia bacterium]|nr:16S rRNA (cytosine(1402)-N(4))-methyltransferase RsmH [Dehalococcoidia bacterium]